MKCQWWSHWPTVFVYLVLPSVPGDSHCVPVLQRKTSLSSRIPDRCEATQLQVAKTVFKVSLGEEAVGNGKDRGHRWDPY